MRTIRTAVLGMLVMLAVPAVAEAYTPWVIRDRAAQRLIPGPFVYGPDMRIVVNSVWTPPAGQPPTLKTRAPGQPAIPVRGRTTLIYSHCPDPNAPAWGFPKYAYRIYKHNKVQTSTCGNLTDFSDYLPLINRAQKDHYTTRKRRARLTACRMVRTTSKKYWPKGDKPRIRIRCNRIRGYNNSGGELNLSYYGSGRRHKLKLLKFTDLGNGFGRLQFWYRDDTHRTVNLTGIV